MGKIKKTGVKSYNRKFERTCESTDDKRCEYTPCKVVLISGKMILSAQCKECGHIPRNSQNKVLPIKAIEWH